MTTLLQRLKDDWSISATVAGFLAVLISYSGPLIIFFQAAQQANVSMEMMISWVWGISIAAAISSIYLSIKFKVPVVMAWSAPGTALLVTLFPEISLNEAVAAYITTAVVLFVIGITGYFDKLLALIPQSLAAAMMAGILVNFGFGIFSASENMPLIVMSMLIVFLIAKRFNPRYSMLWVLAAGVIASLSLGQVQNIEMNFAFGIPQFIQPEWSWNSTLNLAIPLILVSLSGQFLPGMSLLKVSGYDVPAKPILATASITSLLFACTGAITTVLGSITAALCTGKDAHEQLDKRYIAGICNGIFYILGGLFAGTIVLLFSLFPKELVATLAGLALLGAIASNMTIAMQTESQRESALITFLATASGMSLLGMSSVFWGIVFGLIAHAVLTKHESTAPNTPSHSR